MKKQLIYLAFFAAMFTFSSCRISQKAMVQTPINAQINFDMDDLEFIGTVSGTSTQSYALGMAIGGRKYHSASFIGQGFAIQLPPSRGYQNALYDALSQLPDADFVLPVSYNTEVDQQFLGRKEYVTLRCKAYKIKDK